MDSDTNEVVDGFITLGFEHELTDFLLRATQDELNATADPDDVSFFIEDDVDSSITDSDERDDIAGDAIDVALSATSFFAGWINQPINGCHSGEYGRTNTPNEISAAGENTAEELPSYSTKTGDLELMEIVGEPSLRDAITDQILVGLGLRQTSRIEGEYKDFVAREKEHIFTEVVPAETDMPERQQDTRLESSLQYDQAEVRNEEYPSVSSNDDIENDCVRAISANARDDSSGRRGGLAEASCQRGNELDKGTGGKKNDVLKKLVAKCLVRNKKTHEHRHRQKRLPLEPESCVFQLRRPEPPAKDKNFIQARSSDSGVSSKLGTAANRAVIHSVRSDAPSIEIAGQEKSPEDDIPQSEPETGDAPICPEGKVNRSASLDKVASRAVIHSVTLDAPSIEISSQEKSPDDDIPQSEPETGEATICSEGKVTGSASLDEAASLAMIHSVRSDAPSIEIASQENSPDDDTHQSKSETGEAPICSEGKVSRIASLNEAASRTVIHSVRSVAPSIEIASQENSPDDDIHQSEPETRDAPIYSEGKSSRSASRDPPAAREPQKRIGPQTLQLKMNTVGRSSTMTEFTQSTSSTSIPRQEESPLKLKIKSTRRAPIYYSQPPRPEVPFYAGVASNDHDVARPTKKAAKRTSSFSRQSNTKEKAGAVRMSLFGDGMLSSTALLRRKHYKEMLLKERAAGNTTME